MKSREVIVVGAGPAGLVAAIAARKRGLDATVLDARIPPIDKPCGEGILPQGVAALRALGISLPAESTFPFRGIRFVDAERSARADFSGATGFSMRRVKLHQFLIDRAVEAGVELRWGMRVVKIDDAKVTTTREAFSYRWLIGADGQNSHVRKWSGLDSVVAGSRRFGFCTHFGTAPWSNMTEVHWTKGCQIFVTPMCGQEVGVAVLSRDSGLRMEGALRRFPALAEKLRGAKPTTREAGDTTSLKILPAVARGRVALIGDASGTVDALTGHGLSLSFQQAIPLADAMRQGDLALYRAAHKKISAVPVLMTRLMLLMSGSDWIRRRTIRLFQNSPGLFSRMLAIHTEAAPLSSVGIGEIANFGWQFLKPQHS
ncbi:MAG TPA: NAD(P)/FAD-dependent oxidoreductase [Candidatus Sulfotelmatobacter sp.]|jgi:flavin-dependent dehydrogenase|nr:NAD(P)/FAD-dependent oxidoreductase [Candidatus Sulfotelmatobacter sp.]